MANTAVFAVALRGVSVGQVAITGAAANARYDVHAEPANDADWAAIANHVGYRSADRPVDPGSTVAQALWRSLSPAARDAITNAEPELAAELAAEPGGDDDARAAAAAAERARRERARDSTRGSNLPDSK